MTTKTKRVILDEIIKLSKEQDDISLKKEIKNEERNKKTTEEKRLINENYIELINNLEGQIEFLKSLLFDLFD